MADNGAGARGADMGGQVEVRGVKKDERRGEGIFWREEMITSYTVTYNISTSHLLMGFGSNVDRFQTIPPPPRPTHTQHGSSYKDHTKYK